MPVSRIGRAVSLRGTVGLIVMLAWAFAAAEPPFVPPDEQAGLPAVVNPAPTVLPACLGEQDAGPAALSEDEVHGPELPNAWDGEAEEMPAADFAAPQSVASLFTTTGDVPPVVRAQTPEIVPIPLTVGDVPVETTSLLRTITGTKGRVRADYLTDFDDTDRIGAHLLTQGWFNLGIDAEANYWQRPVAGLGREPLWTGDVNLTYNMLPHPRFKFRSGAGAAWRIDDGDAHAGYNVTHGLDVYLLWRFMVSGEADWGKIDDDDLFRYRLALGLTFDFAEIYTGYESYKLGNERLDGWVNGIAIWY